MSVEHSLLELVSLLKSSKKKDRVNGFSSVCSLVQQDRVVSYLSKCSGGSKKGICWDALFSHVHSAVVTEIERGAVSARLVADMGQALITVLGKARGLVKASTVACAILCVFESSEISDVVGKTYLDLASSHLLQLPKYRAELNHDQWTDLVKMCKKQYEHPYAGGSSFKFLDLLRKVVKAGVEYSLPHTTLLSLLPFLQHLLLSDLPPSATFEWNLLQLVNTCLQNLASDARYKVAQFTEAVHERIFMMCKTGKDRSLIFQFYGIAVNVHHPQGVGPDDPLVYASDWSQWKIQLSQIQQICESEVSEIIRFGESSMLSNDFIALLADISYVMSLIRAIEESPQDQLNHDSLMLCTGGKRKSDIMVTQTQKRAKVISFNGNIGSILAEIAPRDHWFWFTYLKVILERHPAAVEKDYLRVVQLICHMLCDTRSPSILGPLSKCAILMLDILPEDPKSRSIIQISWEKAFESLVRSISKDNIPEHHQVIQALIGHGTIKDLSHLLDLYLTGKITNTIDSVPTITHILGTGIVINEDQRCELLRWGLQNVVNPREIANLCISLLYKQFNLPLKNAPKKIKNWLDFKIYRYLTLKEEPVRKDAVHAAHITSCGLYCQVSRVLQEALHNNNTMLHQTLSESSIDYEDWVKAANLIEIMLRIVSFTANASSSFKTELMNLIKPLFFRFTSATVKQIDDRAPLRLEVLSHLYALDLNQDLKIAIREHNFIYDDLVQKLLDLFKDLRTGKEYAPHRPALEVWHEYKSPFNGVVSLLVASNFSDMEDLFGCSFFEKLEQKSLLEVVDVLGEFVKAPGVSEAQCLVATKLTEALEEKSVGVAPLQMQIILRIVYMVGSWSKVGVIQLNACLDAIIVICRLKFTEISVLTMCLVVLKDLIPTIATQGDESSIEKYKQLMEGFRIVLEKRNQTLLTMVTEFIYVLTAACRYPTLAACEWKKGAKMIEDLIRYVKHYSVEVRFKAARAIENIFQLWPADELWQKTALGKLQNELHDLPRAEDCYHKMSVTASSLIALANTFSSTVEVRLQVAYTIIRFIYSQDLNFDFVNNFLELISRKLRVKDASKYFFKHLKELLTEWIREGNGLKDFPYQVVKSHSAVNFYKDHLCVVGAVCFLSGQHKMLEEVASKLSCSVADVLEKSYPIIACEASRDLTDVLAQYVSQEKEEEIQDTHLAEMVYAALRASNKASFLRSECRQTFFTQLIQQARAVQQILLLLEEAIVESVTEEDITDSLNHYAWFIEKFVDDTKTGLTFSEMNCYVLRDAISVVLRIIPNTHPDTLNVGCNLIKYVVEGYLDTLRSEIVLLFPGIVNVLVWVATNRGDCCDGAISLLRYLVIEKKDALLEAIERLDPFPDLDIFSEFVGRANMVGLREEMERFTQVGGHKGRRVGGLARLLRSLETHKKELMTLYEEARTKPSSAKDSCILQKVIHQLVELCSHKDNAVRLEAAKCLGELGPADLGILVVKSENDEFGDYILPEERLVDFVAMLLGQLIQSEELSIKRAACSALYAIMGCQGAMSEYSNFYAPFNCQNLIELSFEAKSAYGPLPSVWVPNMPISHDDWVRGLVVAFLETITGQNNVCGLLVEVCQMHASFAHKLLPLILEVVVKYGTRSFIADVSRNVNAFFTSHIQGGSTLSLKSVRAMVEAVDHLRCWRYRSGSFDSLLNLDLLLVAEAAGNCAAHFTSMLYCELWFEEQKNTEFDNDPSLFHLTIDGIRDRSETLSRVMRAAYASVGIPDGLLGCGSSHLANRARRVAHLEQMGRWDLSLALRDAMHDTSGVANALRNNDLLHTLAYLPSDPQIQLTCAGRLGDWSFVPSPDVPLSFNLHHYSALKALHNHDTPTLLSEVNRATDLVLSCINDNMVESSRDLYQSLSRLQCLKQLRDISYLNFGGSMDCLSKKWALQDLFKPSDFSLMEEAMTLRCVMVKELCSEKDGESLGSILGDLHLRLCKLARHAKRDDVALRNIIVLNDICGIEEDQKLAGRVEEAHWLWRKGEHSTATFLLSQLLELLKGSSKKELRAKCLRLYGNWMIETKAENPRKIIDNYFGESLKLTNKANSQLESFASIAKFADMNYIQRKEYIDSSQFGTRQDNIRQQNSVLVGLMRAVSKGEADREKQAALHCRKMESAIDRDEVRNLFEESMYFLGLAVRYYLLSLQIGNKFDHFVFRLLSLWLNNGENQEVFELLKELLPGIPSYKFISLLPQIVPRMSDTRLLTETVERALAEHPHHTLPVVFALKNAYADQRYTTSQIATPTSRITAAAALVHRAAVAPSTAQLVQQMELFTEALIHLANLATNKIKGVDVVPLRPDFPVAKLENLQHVLVPCVELPIQPNLAYTNIIGVYKFGSSFQMVGGVNAPKKIECHGTDGKIRVLLIKGKDDLRQDAVMQQVFGVINTLLARDEETARRKLVMRTYRVMPLSQRSGIIEWCANTQPLGCYLVGPNNSGGAHARFRPKDMKPLEARQLTMMLQRARSDVEKKLDNFLQICRRFKPVFHYFFLEKFPSAGVCLERRLAYIRSVATSSMIGYILGLGDRHTANILIDNTSAEVIHIDFGIAFEQGKVLPTPETVPFRLTRDIVDGMGLCGVDGVFRACCERTMAVMRENQDTIITLLEVLLYDPLYSWTITPKKAMSLQNDSSECTSSSPNVSESEVNAMAERALLRLKVKLQGMEQGGVVSTVKGQVNGLIQQACDPANLSRLFHGWQAHI